MGDRFYDRKIDSKFLFLFDWDFSSSFGDRIYK